MAGLTLVTPPASEPVTLAEAKLHLRVDHDDENALILALIRAAREYVESFTRRVLITQTWDYAMDALPCESIELPIAPVTSVTSITYLDTAGVSRTWSSAYYQTSLPSAQRGGRARIAPVVGQVFPSTACAMDAATVRFVAGYGTSGSSVPSSLTAALKVLLTHWYEQRGAVNIGNIVTPLPLAVDALLWPYRSF